MERFWGSYPRHYPRSKDRFSGFDDGQEGNIHAHTMTWTYGAVLAEATLLALWSWVSAEEIATTDSLIGELALDQVLLGAGVVARLLLWGLRLGGPRRRGLGARLRPRVWGPGFGRLRPPGGGSGGAGPSRIIVRGPARSFVGLPAVGFAVVVVIVAVVVLVAVIVLVTVVVIVVVVVSATNWALRSCLLRAIVTRVAWDQHTRGL